MARPKQSEIPMSGPGVAPVKDKRLDALCDEFIDARDEKAALAEKLGKIENRILERMKELNITLHKFGDQVAEIKPGKNHVKIKTVKVDSGDDDENVVDDD